MIKRTVQPIMATLVLSTLTYANQYTMQIATCEHEWCVKEITLQGEKKGFSIESYVREKGGYIVTTGYYPSVKSAKKEFKKIYSFKKDAFIRHVDPTWSRYSENIVSSGETPPTRMLKETLSKEEPASGNISNTIDTQVPSEHDVPEKPIVTLINQEMVSNTEKVYRYDCAENRGVTVESNRYKHVVIEYDCHQN